MLKKFAVSAMFLTSCTFPQNCNQCPQEGDIVQLENRSIKLMVLKNDAIKIVADSEKEYGGNVNPFSDVDLGMELVPVLDQGSEGTCVTFATTAALDALLGKGDFISQQCTLELNVALGNNYWNGAWQAAEIIDPLQKYGVIAHENCPDKYPKPNAKIDVKTYESLISGPESAVLRTVEYEYFEDAELSSLKKGLDQGHRVLIGFRVYSGLADAVKGFDVNGHKGGLWACKQGKSPNFCQNSNAGHEVIVIGYDDNQELLKIRNSWGEAMGDQGDYYMSYKFFNSMAINMTIVK